MRIAVLGLAVITSCSVPVAGALDDAEANRVFVALDREHVDATKEADPAGDGKWRVTVARDDLPRALAVMHDEALPKRDLDRAAGATNGSLVPSEAAVHAQVVASTAGELERTLEGIDGVLSARVHLDVPGPAPLRGHPTPANAATSLSREARPASSSSTAARRRR